MSTIPSTPRSIRWRQQVQRAIKTCDLCEGTRFDLICQQDRRGQVLHTGICLRCGLVCHMHLPTEEELSQFYARNYRREYHGERTPSARRVVRAWGNAERIYRQLAPHVQPRDSVLEIGAGIGCNVKIFELHGHDASGIEPNEGFCEFSVRELQTKLVQADLFDIDLKRRYDLVLLVHVIEHFRSPRRALERIHELLQPGGRLYVECPNLAAPFARPGKMFHFAHIHNFTPSSLCMMAQRTGFEVERTFSDPGNPNLQMLWRRLEEPSALQIDPHNLPQTLKALRRYNALTYHLRPRYLKERAAKVCGYFGERVFADRALRRLKHRVQGSAFRVQRT